jgi:hypothetical protein
MTKQQTKFKKAVAIAKQLRKNNPAMKYTDAIKKAFKSLGSTTHKDTKSHNVNIRVVSGVKKKIGSITTSDFKRIDSDINGNPRYVIHFKNIASDYDDALRIAKKVGGKKYHNKKYGGGVAFQSYNVSETAKYLNDAIKKSKIGSTLLLEKGESARKKPTRVKLITRTKAGTFKKWKTLGEAPDFNDNDAAIEIRDFADNNSQLYYSRRMPILKNLYKKWKKGTFKVDLAAKLWKYYIEDAMQKYSKMHGSKGDRWHQLLSVSDRKLLADQYAKETLHDFENHVYSDADMK